MNTIPFPTPRTPKAYKGIPEPVSPLAPYSEEPRKLPSLKSWKDTCRDYSYTSGFTNSSASTISNTFSDDSDYTHPTGDYPIEFLKAPLLLETSHIDEADAPFQVSRKNRRAKLNGVASLVRNQISRIITKSGVSKKKGGKKKSQALILNM